MNLYIKIIFSIVLLLLFINIHQKYYLNYFIYFSMQKIRICILNLIIITKTLVCSIITTFVYYENLLPSHFAIISFMSLNSFKFII